MLAAIALTVAVLMGQSTGTNEPIDYRETFSVHIEHQLGTNSFYPWASVDYGQGYLVGQSVSDLLTVAGGVGYQHVLGGGIKFKAEGGVAYPVHRTDHGIQQEVLFTYLVGRHAVDESRPPPVYPVRPYDQDSYESEFHIDYGAYARVGLEFEATEDIMVYVYYKYFHPKSILEIWDEEGRANGGGWWQEYRSVDMSTIQVGIGWRF